MTAVEYIQKDESGVYNEVDIAQLMIKFAREKVEEAIETVLENVELYHCNLFSSIGDDPYLSTDEGWYIAANLEKAKNSYKLESIK